MTPSLELENAVEIKYDASSCEYTVICACREAQYGVIHANVHHPYNHWTILSVVVIDAIQNRETMHTDLTGRMSCDPSTVAPPLRSPMNRPLSPLHQKGRQSALDAHRSFSSSAMASSKGRSRPEQQGRWIASSFQNISSSSITPRASGRTPHFSFMPAREPSYKYHRPQRIIIFDTEALTEEQELQPRKQSFRL
ncbi:hypothetical protein MHU86_1058 [Fragilaria crotonensis]|nr:hypothetical protein MHU86_1058 [Fragilaria crotonensis]